MSELFVSNIYGTFWALLPPITAIFLAFIVKETYFSLFIGLSAGALLLCNFAPVATLEIIINSFITAIADNAGIFLFLVLIGTIITLINTSGSSAAFGQWTGKHVKSRTGAIFATFVLGILIFVDDSFNCLTVGSVMCPVTDRNKVSHAKLSYLIDVTAAPVCMISPISSWIAAIAGVTANLNTNVSGIELFIRAIPYNFYSLLTFVFVIVLSIMNFDYGPMLPFELEAQLTEYTEESEVEDEEKSQNHVLDLILPLLVLIVSCTISMIYTGGFFEVNTAGNTNYVRNFLEAFVNANAFIALPWGALVTLVFTIAYLIVRRVMSFKTAMTCVPNSFHVMATPIITLSLSIALKNITTMLGADVFIHSIMNQTTPGLDNMLPALIFLVACLLSFASGTSWGTFGILLPIVISIFNPDSTLLIIGISACLAGAVCGDHCSPISNTTVMASDSGQCDHFIHVSTQLPYSITVAAISFVTYIIAGIVQNAVICLAAGSILMIGVLFVIRIITDILR